MPTESKGIWERLFIRAKSVVDKFLYYDNLFDDHIWQIRFSKDNKQKIKYKIEKSKFSMQLKTGDDVFKYLWIILLAVALVGMLVLNRQIGVSDREVAQHEYSELLYNHFHHIGNPDAYKEHPYAHTQAQFIDLITYSVCKSLNVKDIYAIRHLLSSIFGWLLIAYLSFILLKAFSWRAAFFTVFFLSISPRFFGYSLSNIVDVTFAFFFIYSIMQMYYFSRELPVIRTSRLIQITLGILLTLSVHNAGSSLLQLFMVFALLNFFLYNPIKKIFTKEYLKALGLVCAVIASVWVTVFIVHNLCTFFLETSFILPSKAFASLTTNIPFDQNQIFEGNFIGPDNFPTRYFSKYLFITTPTVVLISFLLFFIFFKNAIKTLKPFSIFIFIYTFLFCINRVKVHYMNPDTLWAIHYCIYPLFMLIAVSGVECTLRHINDRYTNFVIVGLLGLLSFMPIRHILWNSPYTSIYFNEISGGIHNAYAKYALDSNFEANKTANEWMKDYVFQHDIGKHYTDRPVVVATNGNAACALFYQDDPHIQLVFKDYDRLDSTWDYYVAYCNQIPVTQLRNGTWPPDTAMHLMTFEQKPMVAFYRNEISLQKWCEQDSLAMTADSLLLLIEN
ncbi:MAG: hypothetical protein J6P54_08315 [Bacteroidales bacterium]|jgi:hypothetical protein|nr:hypothetical protein [Bacteroidales bacterium]